MDERDRLIYLAGFFDGEGCVNIGRQKHKNPHKTTREYWRYMLQTIVANKVESSCRLFYDTFGGHIYSYQAHGATYWRWSAWGPGASVVLEKLLPYLSIKRPVAEVGLRFYSHCQEWNRDFGRKGYPDWIVAARDAMFVEARELNAKQRTNNRAPKHQGPKFKAPTTDAVTH
jgi:hypothetical protein